MGSYFSHFFFIFGCHIQARDLHTIVKKYVSLLFITVYCLWHKRYPFWGYDSKERKMKIKRNFTCDISGEPVHLSEHRIYVCTVSSICALSRLIAYRWIPSSLSTLCDILINRCQLQLNRWIVLTVSMCTTAMLLAPIAWPQPPSWYILVNPVLYLLSKPFACTFIITHILAFFQWANSFPSPSVALSPLN